MNEKEKAKELVNKYSSYLPWYSGKDNINKAKDCAKIAVNEIINHCKLVDDDAALNYWITVLKEIDNLT